jgi:dCTP deaminase
MALSDVEISEALERGEIVIDPTPDVTLIAEASIDLHLGPIIRAFRPNPQGSLEVDLRKAKANDFVRYATEVIDLEQVSTWTLEHGQFAIGYTSEKVTLSSELMARVEGRSSWARFGLQVHNTAPTIQPGYNGVITLEFSNVGPINLKLSNNLVVCQLILERLGQPASKPYSRQFQDSSPDRGTM